MPKLPVQTNPEVAPQPINLPGVQPTRGGEALRNVLGVAQTVRGIAARQSAVNEKADMEEVQRRLDAQRREMIRLRLDDKDGYRSAFTETETGKTKAGVGQTYLDRFDEFGAQNAQGLTPSQQNAYSDGLRGLRLQWQQEVLGYEAGALKQERVNNAAATIDGVSTDAASRALLIPKEVVLSPTNLQAELLGMAAATGSPEFQQAVNVIIEEKGLTGPYAEKARQDFVASHQRLVLESLMTNKDVPKGVIRDYAKSLVAAGALNEKDPKTLAVLEKLNKESVTERVEGSALAMAAAADGARTGRVGAIRAWSQAVASDPALRDIAPQVERRIHDLYDQGEDTAWKNERVSAIDLATIADQYDIQSVNDARLVLPDGTRYSDLRSAQGRSTVARALREVRAGRTKGGAPEPITSARGKSLWNVVKTWSAAEKATLADGNSPLLNGLSGGEKEEFKKLGRDAQTTAGQALEAAQKDVASKVNAIVGSQSSWPQGTERARAIDMGRSLLERRYQENGKVTEQDVADAVLYPFEGVASGLFTRPRFLAPSGTPRTGEKRTTFIDEFGLRSQAEALARSVADQGARVFGGGQVVHVSPTGEYRSAMPGDPVPRGWTAYPVLGGDNGAFDEGF